MSRRARLILFLAAAGVLVGFVVAAGAGMARFGGDHHPYRDLAIPAAVAHRTANVVSSVNFDQRGLDTLIEETILLGSVLATTALLRPRSGEEERRVPETGRILQSTRLLGYVMLPLTVLIGINLVVHGHLTPGGGFQGGVVIATGIHLLYVSGSFRAVEGIRPLLGYRLLESVAAAGFACLGAAGLIASSAFLANFIDHGTFGALFSGGTVPVLNGMVGVEVAAGVVVLLAHFLDQEIVVRREHGGTDSGGTKHVERDRSA